MRKLALAAACLSLVASVAFAQDKAEAKPDSKAEHKIQTSWACSKPSTNPVLQVGDKPDHAYTMGQGTCTASKSADGSKTGAFTEFEELWKETYKGRGNFNVTMENGDIVYYSYDTAGSTDGKKPIVDNFKVVSGTGKHKGIKGSGRCMGTPKEDGTADFVCKGTYSMGSM